MCKASLWAKHHEMARQGETHAIGISEHGLPALHPVGADPKQCITCVPDKTVLTLSNIPPDLQKKFGVGNSAVVAFVDTGDNKHDMLNVSGRQVVLGEFADKGILAYVGVHAIDDGAGLGEPASREAVEA